MTKPVYIFTTGDANALKAEHQDRRFMVLDSDAFLRATAEHLGLKTTPEALKQLITPTKESDHGPL